MTKPVYLHTDNDVEILKTFDMVLSHMQAIADPYQWKWVITGWYSILQNAMVLALCQGDDFQVYLADGKASTRDIYQQICNDDFTNINKLQLPSFMTLYRATRKSSGFTPSEDCTVAMDKLHQLRNDFIHYHPGGWSLQVDGLPQWILQAVNYWIISLPAVRSYAGMTKTMKRHSERNTLNFKTDYTA
ncbi:hypothetical protein [Klebsiella aerogenes]|uniref:hypothetical protein n=1 Tax=Klebsiella aerogenes TaxID=548 RepID=UPI000AE54A8B|nr:hypothetical protein [Klebsiella aerogenes]